MKPDTIAGLRPDDLARIEELLGAFVREASARCALLLDRHGRALTASGDTAQLDQVSFASLAAADFEASNQLAGLLGEHQFHALYHQGVDGSMYLSDIAGIVLLAAVFDRRTTLGMVKLKTREVVPRLVAVLSEIDGRGGEEQTMEAGWGDAAASQIDRLFAG